LKNETLTNIFWGLFLVWVGIISALWHGDLYGAFSDPVFGLGTGLLLLVLNLARSLSRLRLSMLTLGLGGLLTLIYAPLAFFKVPFPFLPALIIIAGVALVIGALRSRNYV
jgi:hypothetical protein